MSWVIVQALTVSVIVDNKDHSPSGTEDSEFENHGFKLPLPFSPKKSPPAAISTSLPIEGQTDGFQEVRQLRDAGTHNGRGEQVDLAKSLPFRSSAASTFHAHPTPPSEITDTTSPTASSSRGNNLGQSFSLPQPTPPTDVTPSPTQLSYQHFPQQGYGHAHNISFHAPPPLSSNGTASPARSTYQVPAYQHASHLHSYSTSGYPSGEAHAGTQPPDFSQHRASDSILSGQAYGPQSSYSQPSSISAPGSQPSFIPSATPFENIPQHWNYPTGYPLPGPWENGYPPPNSSLLHPDTLYHSTSPSTFKSDRITSRLGGEADKAVQPSPNESSETNPWRSTRSSTSREVSAPGPNVQASLIGHILENFNNEEYADCHFILIHDNGRFPNTRWSLSSLLLAQSPRLRQMLRQSIFAGDGMRIIALGIQGRFMTPNSIEAALRVCYGEPATIFTSASPSEPPQASNEELSMSRMKHCLDYAGSGCFLRLTGVMLRGLEVASSILNWENLEIAISFGLESVQEEGESASAAVIEGNSSTVTGADRNYLRYAGDRRPSSCALFTPPSQKGQHIVSGLSPPGSDARLPIQSPYDFFKHCLRFIKEEFPTDWQLDAKARPLADVDRLPVTKQQRSPLSSSRLGHIQFGQMPSEVEKNSSNPDVLISTIVLSITFSWLDFILKTMGEPIRRNLVAIVNERERRRRATLQSEEVVKQNRMIYENDAYRWGEAGFEESVQISDDGEMILSRRYAGIGCDPRSDRTPGATMIIGDE